MIRERREARNETQQDVADALGKRDKTVIGWEKGKYFPNVMEFFDLLDHLGIPYEIGDSNIDATVRAAVQFAIEELGHPAGDQLKAGLVEMAVQNGREFRRKLEGDDPVPPPRIEPSPKKAGR